MMAEITPAEPKSVDRITLVLRWALGLVAVAIVLAAGWVAFAYASTPTALRQPAQTHFHFRLQLIADGKPVNFAEDKYQTDFNQDICTATLTKQPVHFHDKLDQFVHIHWSHITGGIVLKNYGWNFIGGSGGTLGYRFDQLPKLVRVPIQGGDLPPKPSGAHYYVYTGDDAGYQQRPWKEFLNRDLSDFIGGKSSATSWLERFVPTASAHGGHEDELAQLNHLTGNVVIFAQKDPPTDAQIKDRFNHLVPLPESACAG